MSLWTDRSDLFRNNKRTLGIKAWEGHSVLTVCATLQQDHSTMSLSYPCIAWLWRGIHPRQPMIMHPQPGGEWEFRRFHHSVGEGTSFHFSPKWPIHYFEALYFEGLYFWTLISRNIIPLIILLILTSKWCSIILRIIQPKSTEVMLKVFNVRPYTSKTVHVSLNAVYYFKYWLITVLVCSVVFILLQNICAGLWKNKVRTRQCKVSDLAEHFSKCKVQILIRLLLREACLIINYKPSNMQSRSHTVQDACSVIQ